MYAKLPMNAKLPMYAKSIYMNAKLAKLNTNKNFFYMKTLVYHLSNVIQNVLYMFYLSDLNPLSKWSLESGESNTIGFFHGIGVYALFTLISSCAQSYELGMFDVPLFLRKLNALAK